MVTMKDVAKEANVSVATVSFYINHKSVSEDKALRIAAAIEKLNYVVHGNGRELRVHNTNEIGIIFPNIDEPYLEKIISSIKGYLNYHSRSFSLELSDDDPESEMKSLMGFVGRRFSGIILYSCQPGEYKAFDLLASSGIPYVLIDRKPADYEGNYVCCDNESLFYHLTTQLVLRGKNRIALITGPVHYNESAEALSGYLKALDEKGLNFDPARVIHARTLRESGFRAGIDLIETNNPIPDAILTTSLKLAEGLRYALRINRIEIGDKMPLISSGDLRDDVFYQDRSIIKTSRSSFAIGEAAGELLLQNIKSPVVFDKQQIRVKDTYTFPQPMLENSSGIRHKSNKAIRVLILDDFESVNALQRLLVDFYSKESISIELKTVHPENSYEYIVDNLRKPGSGIDAFLFDIPWLPYFVSQDILLCLDKYFDSYAVDTSQYVDGIFEYSCRYNGHYYSLPYMASTQLMFYRRDLFQNEHLRRQFEKQYRIPLQPPKTWLDYYTISKFFTRKYTPSSPVTYGHAMDIPYTELLLCSFWPRLWAYNGSISDNYGRINIRTAAAKKAVLNLLECVMTAHPDLLQSRPTNAVDKLVNGEVAMLTTFFNYATGIADLNKSQLSRKIGHASIPGKMPVLGGWCFGISKYSLEPDAAFRFIKWSSCADIAVPHTILGGQSPQRHTYYNYDIISLYPWLTKAASEFLNAKPRVVNGKGGHLVYSEKQVEEIIAEHLFPLVEQAVNNKLPNHAQIEEALERMQLKLEKLNKSVSAL